MREKGQKAGIEFRNKVWGEGRGAATLIPKQSLSGVGCCSV